jgi:hypothetical protein
LLRCPAPPKPPLDQERLQLIALSCIRHPGHTRGRTLLCSHQGNFAAYRRSVQDRSSALLCSASVDAGRI